MLDPISTYRIQFHKDFTFKDFNRIIPYLQQLGVHTIYASPILQAVPGSMHGYDTINPHLINPEIGTLKELKAISGKLKTLGMQWIQDIVPNHMAFHPDNKWLMDVLEKGAGSAYAEYFDINWTGDKKLPLMVPFLGSTLEETIEKGEMQLVNAGDKIWLKFNDALWPLNTAVSSVDMPLQEAIDAQFYRPCHWQETNYQINFRRFFTVNALICLNIQHQETFNDYHKLIKDLLEQEIFDGLRVDHIDGLYDPEGYLEQLRALAGEEKYIIIEKILEKGEEMPGNWPVEGNTGYDFLARTNNLFTNRKAEKKFTSFYNRLTTGEGVEKLIEEKKAAILRDYMGGELDNLYQYFLTLNLLNEKYTEELNPDTLKAAIGQLLIHCPVYRFYGNELPLTGKNLHGLKKLIKGISEIKSLRKAASLLEKVFIKVPEKGDKDFNIRAAGFYLRCMQFSGPLMAKGVEDTLMYTYSRFIGHNEVGDAPGAFGESKEVIHNWMWIRQNEWPLTLNGTSTHDTKRGEDVRARLNVLSDLPKDWIHAVRAWKILNAGLTAELDPADEYFIYQTLIGSYPMPGMPDDQYGIRLKAYLEKALREGKKNSGWEEPDLAYEKAAQDFALQLLNPVADFWDSFTVLHRKVADFGIINSLAQLVLKFTCPGVPDVYQGTELWDLSLVDPDNRRPVDYALREEWLQEIKRKTLAELWEERFSGKIKMLLLHILLKERKSNADIFADGAYLPLSVKGKYAAHVFAFARRKGPGWLITVIPLNLFKLADGNGEEILSVDWKDTRIILPAGAPVAWDNLLTGNSGKGAPLMVAEVLSDFPLALLKMGPVENERSAGILLHITSLPSPYGIGDLGTEARSFIDFLYRSGQTYWQFLPLNPINEDQAFSPYSSVSAIAGNTLLISPDLLVADGLLQGHQLEKWKLPLKEELNFRKAGEGKNELLKEAYRNFKRDPQSRMKKQFGGFCKKESDWLDDFALYTVIRSLHNFLPWYKWELGFRYGEADALLKVSEEYKDELLFVKWQQFIFFRQWEGLKEYGNRHGIKFYGDLPFYLSYDSAEVWSKREMFSVNSAGEITGVAGVPPDYFNEDGQLWGMPVYNWEEIRKDGFRWWIQRIRKNMELYDLLRLDHFRAFSDYWEVPAGESTAISGIWKKGPGADLMQVLKSSFPDMPFVAEDLGEINPDVYVLRDSFKLAGMKVLQFAFGKDMAVSEHIPYRFRSDNFVVYTGTHDNDTTVGWFEKEATKLERKHLSQYAGKSVGRKSVNFVMAQLAYASVARIVILPMQDVLGLDGQSRMNKPASVEGNWAWRLKERPSADAERVLKRLVKVYGRI